MIPEAEVRRLAGRWGVDPMAVDLDYVLGCFLASLYRQDGAAALRFKGGSCLRKCYYPDYRFSEDLDFTGEGPIRQEELERLLATVVRSAADEWQIDFGVRPIRAEVVDDEYGKESYEVRLYYRGPLRRGGDPRAIRLDVTTDELLAFPPAKRAVSYSDAVALAGVEVPCYDLLEVLAEKVRALAGQRRYAISRDLYDISQLAARHKVDVNRLAAALPAKMKVKGLDAVETEFERLDQRREEFKADWERNLVHLLPPGQNVDFDGAWQTAMAFLAGTYQALRAVLGKG